MVVDWSVVVMVLLLWCAFVFLAWDAQKTRTPLSPFELAFLLHWMKKAPVRPFSR